MKISQYFFSFSRFQANSEECRQLANEVQHNIMVEGSVVADSAISNNSAGYGGNSSNNSNALSTSQSSVVIILDRRDDPITPLLHQWTYEAMVHQLLGVNVGRVSLANVPGVPDELKEVVMTPTQDQFYEKVNLAFGI